MHNIHCKKVVAAAAGQREEEKKTSLMPLAAAPIVGISQLPITLAHRFVHRIFIDTHFSVIFFYFYFKFYGGLRTSESIKKTYTQGPL